ncbi:potassium voltage-gated channel subfamily G member 1-like isoform X2 [Phycodurus eques]|uniref:potassium voltage-gated channel subfamily G member 1-like isoform X2 n=1 Tax=Phycodurus eques TaxID=693459 RepID=UPI002ACD76EF|nr:potassium voltage-gated channel subfamily G member 1-like isoform X2 [Phycodurus eques]XP_061543424.1 potassium voltage-gated channel subfamily G member 1-like isoform X2 [Phycodurus eques]XP_061543426.1 potassium voltage-gated channel subfamily G member 1-like isoform X2 [Phycodurus eques]XP_061543427.1 potassium voltage-gated channel subfamily G member 1-like isoform X2 [Phycodurus eques]
MPLCQKVNTATERRGGARGRPDGGEGALRVNVGGLRRSVRCGALAKFPDTRLGKLLECRSEEDILQVCDDYDVQRKEFYFDRNPGVFPYVLHFYHTGKLHVTDELCVFCFSQEMEYWGIGDFFLDSCCSFRYHERKLGSRRRASWDDDDDGDGDDDDDIGGDRAEDDDIRRLRTWGQKEGAGAACWSTRADALHPLPPLHPPFLCFLLLSLFLHSSPFASSFPSHLSPPSLPLHLVFSLFLLISSLSSSTSLALVFSQGAAALRRRPVRRRA